MSTLPSRARAIGTRPLRALLVSTALASCFAAVSGHAQTLPDRSILSGDTATITNFDIGTNAGYGKRVDLNDVNQVITWNSFNVGTPASSVERIDFTSATNSQLAVLNRVAINNPSQIFGSITSKSNITVWLVNPSGITFGNTGSFSGGSLVLSTAALGLGFNPADFIGGAAPIALNDNGGGARGIVLTAGTGALAAAGPIVLVAQNITANKTITSTGGDVALIAASDVVVPNAFGSPLGIAITKGTTMATAKVDVNGAITGQSVRLYGASRDDLTAALLSIGTDGVLTASSVGGKVVLSAGKADGTDMTFTGAAPGDVDGSVPIALAGRIRFDNGGSVLAALNSNAGVTGGGSIGSASSSALNVAIDTADTSDVQLGDIFSTRDFALERTANISLGNVTVSDGHIDLKTKTPGAFSITTGALSASNAGIADIDSYVHVDASGGANVGSASSSSGSYVATAADNVSISGVSDLVYGGGTSAAAIAVHSTTGTVSVTGSMTAATNVTVAADAGSATVGGDVDARNGFYTVDGTSVTLGSTGTTVLQKASDYVAITAAGPAGGIISGIGTLTLQSNSLGTADAGDAKYLSLTAATDIDFADTTSLLAGTNNQSALGLLAAGNITVGTARARQLALANDLTNPILSTPGDFTADSLTVINDLKVESVGAIRVRTAQSTAGSVEFNATGLATVTGPIDAFTNYYVTGSSVLLGDGTSVSQAANGFVSIVANSGSISGASGLVLQSNKLGVADVADTAYVSLVARGGAIDFAANSQVLAGTNLQSLLLLNGATGVIANDPTAINLGIVKARRLAPTAAPANPFITAGDFTVADLLSAEAIDITSTGGALRIGKAVSQNGSIALTTQSTVGGVGDISGLLPVGAPGTPVLTDYGRGDLTAATTITVSASGGVKLGAIEGLGAVSVASGSLGVSDGVIDVVSVKSTNDSFNVSAYSGNPLAAIYNGSVTLGSGSAALDGTLSSSHNVTVGGTSTLLSVGRNLTINAGTVGVSTDSVATIAGDLTVGSSALIGDLTVTGTSVRLIGGTQQASGAIKLRAYGTGLTDGLFGTNQVRLISNSTNDAGANAMILRSDGGAGIQFTADTTLLGGSAGQSADIGIWGPLSQLSLGRVTARSLQGVTTDPAVFGTLANPNAVEVLGNVTLQNDVTVLGKLDIRSQGGFIDTQNITTGAASSNDRGLYLSAMDATNGSILAHGDLLAHGNVTLNAYGAIRLKSVTAAPSTIVPGDDGSITISTTAGDVTGFSDSVTTGNPFRIGDLVATANGVSLLALPDNAMIDGIMSALDVTLTGQNIRLGSATSTSGAISINTTGALTGTNGTYGGVGTVSANLTANSANGSITVTAGGAGNLQTVSLNNVQATNGVTITADKIAVNSATSSAGLLKLAAGSVLQLGTGTGGSVEITGTGTAIAPPVTSDFDNNILDTNFGSTNLTAQANGQTITVVAGSIAQLGTVSAGTNSSVGLFDQVSIDAGALRATSITARNGNIVASATRVAGGLSVNPLYVGTISASNGVTLTKTLGSTASTSDEIRVGQINAGLAGVFGDVTIDSATNARLGPITTTGFVNASAIGDLTGLILPVPGPVSPTSPPQVAYGLLGINAGAISLSAGRDIQANGLIAATDIDATAGNIAWIGGNVTANNGHYRVTGGTVSLGALGNAVQKADGDVAIRSVTGGITGGSGLTLQSASGGSSSIGSYLVLDSAADISFADGLQGDTISLLLAGSSTSNLTADIGIRLANGARLQLGSVRARSIGSVGAPIPGNPAYSVSTTLTTAGEIAMRDVVVSQDLLIDNFDIANLYNLTLDSAVSQGGGIQLSTAGQLKGHELVAPGPGNPDGVYVRTNLTAANAIETESGFGLFGTVDAGTAVQLLTNASRLDATTVTARAGDAVLRANGDLRVNSVTASGDGSGLANAVLLANPGTAPLRHLAHTNLTTAGDINASSVNGDITDTNLGGTASFGSTTGGVTLGSTADGAGLGLVSAANVTASGTNAGHRDVAIDGRRIAIGTLVQSVGGDVTLTASQLATAQTNVSVTATQILAAGNVSVTAGFGTAAPSAGDNGSIRVGAINAGTGSVTLAALDGDITGLAGSSDSLDAGHNRIAISAGQAVTARSGGLVLGGLVQSGAGTLIEAGDVSQAGMVANNGAIDITRAVSAGALSLTARSATLAGGYNGDVRLGATATGLFETTATGSTAGLTAVVTTLGQRGDVVIASSLVSTGDLTVNSVANARLAGGDTPPFTTHYIGSTAGNLAVTAVGGDITGLLNAGAPGTQLTDYGRADLKTDGVGTITAIAGSGTLQLGSVVAGVVGTTNAADQIIGNARAIDIVTATANNGNLNLTSTAGDVVLTTGTARTNATILASANTSIGTLTATTGFLSVTTQTGNVVLNAGSAETDATILAAANARIGTLQTTTGNIGVTATNGDVTGLLNPGAPGTVLADFGRADLTTGGIGTITATAAAGTLQLGAVTAGTVGTTNALDQIIGNARAIDITTAIANNGNITLTSTAGDVVLATGTARTNATILASANTSIGALTATTGFLSVTTQAGNVVLNAGSAETDATILAAANARIGTLQTTTGNIGVTATNGDVTGMLIPGMPGTTLADFGRADLTTGGIGTITATAAAGTLQLGTVTAGTVGATNALDQIIGNARAIDITTATANNGNLKLTSTAGDVVLATGAAQTNATILAAANARIGTLQTITGNIAVTATSGDVTGLLNPGAPGTVLADFGRADLTTGGIGTITATAAAGALQLGTVTAGTVGTTNALDQIIGNARAIDIITATANNGNLKLTSTAGDVVLTTGTARTNATILASANATIDALTATTGFLSVTTQTGNVALNSGSAQTDATILAAANARIGTLQTTIGNIAVTATNGDVTGLLNPGAPGTVLADFGRADLTTGGIGTITATAALGTLQLGAVTAGTTGVTNAVDQIVGNARAIDITTAIANNGNIKLTATAGNVVLATGTAQTNATILASGNATIGALTATTGLLSVTTQTGNVVLNSGSAQTDATILAAANARIGTLQTTTGNIAVTATNGDVTGLLTPGAPGTTLADFGRADLTTGGVGTITATAALGTLQLGAVTAGTTGVTNAVDQIVGNARAIDITTATANNGNIKLTSTGGDVRLGTGTARNTATILAATNASIDSLTAATGAISVTTQTGNVVLGAGSAQTNATILAAANARIGTLQSTAGNIGVTATAGDISGLLTPGAPGTTLADFGRADLTTGGSGTITATAAAGALKLGTVTAGITGPTNIGDQIVGSAQSIDITTATANNGNLKFTSTLGDVVLGTGTAQTNATILAAANATIDSLTATTGALSVTSQTGNVTLGSGAAQTNATILAATDGRIGTLQTTAGNIGVTATNGNVTGLLIPGMPGTTLADFGRANLTTGGTGTITVTAATGALQLGTVTAGVAGTTSNVDQIVGNARMIDITNATANNGNLVLTATAGDVVLGIGSAQVNATILASTNARIDALTAKTGALSVTATTGTATLGTGTAQTNATVQAVNARIGALQTTTGNIGVTATGGDVTGLLTPGAPGTALTDFGRANLTTGGVGTITVTAATGSLRLGTVTAGTVGTTNTSDQIVGNARAIDITTATANNGNLLLTSTAGDVMLGAGTGQTNATINAAANAGIDSLTATTGALSVTAATGSVRLGAGAAQTTATVQAATSARIGTLRTTSGNIGVTATNGDITGLLNANAPTTTPSDHGAAAFTAGGTGTVTLSADLGTAKLGAVSTANQTIAVTAADAVLTGLVDAGTSKITVLRGSGSTKTLLGSAAQPSGGAALNLDATEVANLRASTVQIGSRIAQAANADDVTIGNLAINAATGSSKLQLLGTGIFRLNGAISDAGSAVSRTLQIGGSDMTLPLDQALTNQPLASQIRATLVPGSRGALINLPSASVDLRGQRINFGSAEFLARIDNETNGLDNPAAGQIVADRDVSKASSPLYNGFLKSSDAATDVYLKANTLQVSYAGYALFQNTGPSSLGKGISLGSAQNGSTTQIALTLRSTGGTVDNSFALFGTINGFTGRTAGILPNDVVNFFVQVGGNRTSRINQPNSRINGCVIGSPDRGCLITDVPPPTLQLFDESQLQLFGVTEDLTIPIEQTVGTSNEALIGDFTTTGGLINADCTVPGGENCPEQGAKP